MKGKKSKDQKKPKKKGPNKSDETLMDFMGNEYTEITSKVKENLFLVFIFILVFLMVFFQYKYEYKESQGLNKINEGQYYTVLGLEEGSSLEEVRSAYKKLVRVWHPDKHINCKSCKEKFNQITEAYENIIKTFEEGDKRSIFENSPIILNYNNYQRLVESSQHFWLIFVYNSRQIDYFTQRVVAVYNEINKQLKGTIRFGTIDVSREEQLLLFLPYKFPILPTIYTYDGRTGINEIFQKIDSINEINLFNFIQSCYSSSINLIDINQINNFVGNEGKEININHLNNDMNKNIDLHLFVISSKHFIDLAAKDFQRRYEKEIVINQNALGTYDETLKKFDKYKKGNDKYRVYASYNKIIKNSKNKNDIKLKRVIEPIPIEIDYREKTTKEFIKIFEITKKLIMPKIHRSNFISHCKSVFENVMYKGEQGVEGMKEKRDICVIELLDDENIFSNDTTKVETDFKFEEEANKYLYETITKNFEKENEETKNKNNNFISINYATSSLKENKKLKEFIIEFEKRKNNLDDDSDLKDKIYTKRFLVIDINNHQFVLKRYNRNNIENMKNFFEQINTEEALEDMSLGYEYFTDFVELEETSFLFDEIKVFSIKNVLSNSVYSQTKPRYLIVWSLVFFSFMFLFKEPWSVSLFSTFKMVFISTIVHIAIYGYNSYIGNI